MDRPRNRGRGLHIFNKVTCKVTLSTVSHQKPNNPNVLAFITTPYFSSKDTILGKLTHMDENVASYLFRKVFELKI